MVCNSSGAGPLPVPVHRVSDTLCIDLRPNSELGDVCFWHLADMRIALGNVRFRG